MRRFACKAWPLLCGLLLSSGCATQPLDGHEKRAAFGLYRSDPFAPVNVFINSGDFVTHQQSAALRYLREQLVSSAAFSRVEVGVHRWPVTLDLRYNDTAEFGIARFLAVMVFAGSLGVVPAVFDDVKTLSIDVLHGRQIAKTFTFSETVRTRMSLYDMGNEGRSDRAAIDRLLVKALAQLESSGLVPHVSDYEPPKEPEESST